MTAEAFEPFGTLLTVPQRKPDIAGEHHRYWDDAVPFQVDGVPQVGFLEVSFRPLVVPSMERHLLHTQTFIPLAGSPLVLVVAPPSARVEPDVEAFRAFLLDGRQGVLLRRGTWHHFAFSLVPTAHVVILLQEGTKETDMHVVQLAEAIRVQL